MVLLISFLGHSQTVAETCWLKFRSECTKSEKSVPKMGENKGFPFPGIPDFHSRETGILNLPISREFPGREIPVPITIGDTRTTIFEKVRDISSTKSS